MPNRIIKESIRTSKKVNSLTDFQFRLWINLITYVDDYGRGSADPELLKGFLFPRRKGITETQIQDALSNLANTGMITLYEADGESYLYFPNWGDHQRIQTKKSKFPSPPSSTVTHGDSPPESNPIQYESNTNTNTNTTYAHEGDEDASLGRAISFYMENVGMNVPSSLVTASIRDFIKELSEDVVLHAMEIASEADKHDWRYVKAILERYRASGFKTIESVKADEAKAKHSRTKKDSAQYTNDPFEGWSDL